MIATNPQAAESLHKKNFYRTYGLKTWQLLKLEKGASSLNITALPARHAPGPLASLLPPVMGSLLEFQVDGGRKVLRVYISGDTLMCKALHEIPEHFPTIDLALLHLGGAKIAGLMVTMNGKQGLQLVKLIHPHEFIPIHYNDYGIFTSPLAEFQHAVEEAQLSTHAHYLKHGDTYTFSVPLVPH
jgi:L-ascorbate metabolism protein UlaG (beta-lactamase superfamily)